MAKVRLTRPLNGGLIKIRDRVIIRDESGKEDFEDRFHVLGVEHSPIKLMVKRKQKVQKPDAPKGQFDYVETSEMIPAKDENGKLIFAKPGFSFEVADLDYVMEYHHAILEQVND